MLARSLCGEFYYSMRCALAPRVPQKGLNEPKARHCHLVLIWARLFVDGKPNCRHERSVVARLTQYCKEHVGSCRLSLRTVYANNGHSPRRESACKSGKKRSDKVVRTDKGKVRTVGEYARKECLHEH